MLKRLAARLIAMSVAGLARVFTGVLPIWRGCLPEARQPRQIGRTPVNTRARPATDIAIKRAASLLSMPVPQAPSEPRSTPRTSTAVCRPSISP